jgi:hypothetical protein
MIVSSTQKNQSVLTRTLLQADIMFTPDRRLDRCLRRVAPLQAPLIGRLLVNNSPYYP